MSLPWHLTICWNGRNFVCERRVSDALVLVATGFSAPVHGLSMPAASFIFPIPALCRFVCYVVYSTCNLVHTYVWHVARVTADSRRSFVETQQWPLKSRSTLLRSNLEQFAVTLKSVVQRKVPSPHLCVEEVIVGSSLWCSDELSCIVYNIVSKAGCAEGEIWVAPVELVVYYFLVFASADASITSNVVLH